MRVSIKFLGASGTVTGSKYLVSFGDKKILIDAGIFQGSREWREKNWHDPEFSLREVNAVLLTHAHIDHTGILPRYVKLGLKCPVYCTAATYALSQIMLPDSGHLQEEEAQYRQFRGRSRHHPPLPLYTEEDAIKSLELFRSVDFEREIDVLDGVKATWYRMGHILGAGAIALEFGGKRIVFSGDIGRYDVPILVNPTSGIKLGDLLLVESTYGNRLHGEENPKYELARVIKNTAARGGLVLIPSFAVGRTQQLLYYLRELKQERAIPDIPVVIDSPMARDATALYRDFPGDYDEEALGILKRGTQPFSCSKLAFVKDRESSIKLNSISEPMVLISASGMLTGGRVLHHLKNRVSDPRNTVLFVGFQSPGGRGDWMLQGHNTMRLLGEDVPVRAHIEKISGLSAHGDRNELLRWAKSCEGMPGKVAVVHGEKDSAREFSETLRREMKWNAACPEYLAVWDL